MRVDNDMVTVNINHDEGQVKVTHLNPARLPGNVRLLRQNGLTLARFALPNGTIRDEVVFYNFQREENAKRLKANILDDLNVHQNYSVASDKFSESVVEDSDHVLAVYLNPKTKKVHIQLRDKDDPRWVVDLNNMTVTWPCDEEFAGTYHIVAFNLKKGEGETRKRELYAVYQGMGFTKIKARNQVLNDVRLSRIPQGVK